jgi:hypothetical protein
VGQSKSQSAEELGRLPGVQVKRLGVVGIVWHIRRLHRFNGSDAIISLIDETQYHSNKPQAYARKGTHKGCPYGLPGTSLVGAPLVGALGTGAAIVI